MVFQYKPTNDLTGKLVVVTGGSSGVGRASCFALAKLNCTLIIAARNETKTRAVIEEIKTETKNLKIEFLLISLDDLESCRNAAQVLLTRNEPIDILMNNGGIAGITGMSKDGFELTFATNHLVIPVWLTVGPVSIHSANLATH